MRDGLGKCHALQPHLAGGQPKRNGSFSKPRSREVVSQHFGFGSFDFREALFDHLCDLAVQLLSTAFEQRVISRVLHQCMLEGVDRIGRRATAEGQRLHQS
jgi:hypothetical protein